MVIPVLLKSRSVWFAILLAMADAATATISGIYAYSIFLSKYPTYWLAYLIVLQTFFAAFMRVAGMFFATSRPKKTAFLQYLFCISILIGCVAAIKSDWYWAAFAVAIITAGVSSLNSSITWNLLSLSFGLRDYKNVAAYANRGTFASAIISSFLIPVLVKFFSNMSLLVASILIITTSSIMMHALDVQKTLINPSVHKKQSDKIPGRYPLYYQMMFFTIVVGTIISISQYLMRLEAADYYLHEQLSAFLGYFSGVTNILGILIAFTTQRVLKQFGLETLLLSVPIASFFSAILVIISPKLWSTVVLASVRNVFSFSYGNYAYEIILNILPPSVRFIAKGRIKAVSVIVSTLPLLAFSKNTVSVAQIAAVLPFLCLIATYSAHKIKELYRLTLLEESAFKRYNILEQRDLATTPVFKDIALQAIQSNDTYTIFYGLDLLFRLHLKHLPKTLYDLLHHNDPQVRYAVINLIKEEHSKTSLPYLLEQVTTETNFENRFTIIQTLVNLDKNKTMHLVKSLPDTIFMKVLVPIYLINDPLKKEQALSALRTLAHDPDPLVRKMIAAFIGNFKITELSDSLGYLINDDTKKVSNEALLAAANAQLVHLLPQISQEVIKRRGSYTPRKALITLGASTLPYLYAKAFDLKTAGTYISAIAAIPGVKIEQVLSDIITNGSIYHRGLAAKFTNNRSFTCAPSEQFKQKAKQLAKEECAIIAHLNTLLQQSLNPAIKNEIGLRIKLAKTRFLQWIAISTRPKEVNQLASALLQDFTQANQPIIDKAVELLEIYVNDTKMRSYINYVYENQTLADTPNLPLSYHDPWLDTIMDTNMNQNDAQSSVLSIVFQLRAVELFKELPAEVLMAIAQEAEYCAYNAGDVIFSENDEADGLYCVCQGEVDILRQGTLVTTITEHGFFGELALLDGEKRVGTARAKNQCFLLYIEKEVFNRIADDVPDVLRTIVKVILGYLRKNLVKPG